MSVVLFMDPLGQTPPGGMEHEAPGALLKRSLSLAGTTFFSKQRTSHGLPSQEGWKTLFCDVECQYLIDYILVSGIARRGEGGPERRCEYEMYKLDKSITITSNQ